MLLFLRRKIESGVCLHHFMNTPDTDAAGEGPAPKRTPANGCARRRTRRTAALRIRAVLFLYLWLAATGTHWDMVQIFAWAQMWADNVKTESAGNALASTFAPENMCGLCKTVQAAKNAASGDNALALEKIVEKARLLPLADGQQLVIPPPVASRVLRADRACPPSLREAPPLPPPRTAA
jgi:hypothetical protein